MRSFLKFKFKAVPKYQDLVLFKSEKLLLYLHTFAASLQCRKYNFQDSTDMFSLKIHTVNFSFNTDVFTSTLDLPHGEHL